MSFLKRNEFNHALGQHWNWHKPGERVVGQQIFPVFGFDVQFLDGFVGKNVSGGLNGGDVGVIVEILFKKCEKIAKIAKITKIIEQTLKRTGH